MAAEPGYVAASITVDRLDSKYDLVLNPNTNGYTPNRLYGWKSSLYYDKTNTSQPLILYTEKETPSVGDKVYVSGGKDFDGNFYTGAELGQCTGTTISSISNDTIVIGD